VLRTEKETSIASSYKRGFPPIPPVGITIGPVGKLSVAEPEPELEDGVNPEPEAGMLGSEILGREEPEGIETEGIETDGAAETDGNEMEADGLLA